MQRIIAGSFVAGSFLSLLLFACGPTAASDTQSKINTAPKVDKKKCGAQFNFRPLDDTPPRIALYQFLRAKKTVTVCIGSVGVAEREKINQQLAGDVRLAFETWLAALGPDNPLFRPHIFFKDGRCSGADALVNVTGYGDVALWNSNECKWSTTGTCLAHVGGGVTDAFIDPWHLSIVNPSPTGFTITRDYGKKTILHEVGHILGLNDTWNIAGPQPSGIMNLYYNVDGYQLTTDDVQGIKHIYNRMAAYDPPPPTIAPSPTATPPSAVASPAIKPTAVVAAKTMEPAMVRPPVAMPGTSGAPTPARTGRSMDSTAGKKAPTGLGEPPPGINYGSDCAE